MSWDLMCQWHALMLVSDRILLYLQLFPDNSHQSLSSFGASNLYNWKHFQSNHPNTTSPEYPKAMFFHLTAWPTLQTWESVGGLSTHGTSNVKGDSILKGIRAHWSQRLGQFISLEIILNTNKIYRSIGLIF